MTTTRQVHFRVSPNIIPLLESRLPELELAKEAAWELFKAREDVADRAYRKWQEASNAEHDCREAIDYYRRRFAKTKQNALLDTPVTDWRLMQVQSRINFWRALARHWRDMADEEERTGSHMTSLHRNYVRDDHEQLRLDRQTRRRIWREMISKEVA